jgi:polysaccharide biosynthesis transport protein
VLRDPGCDGAEAVRTLVSSLMVGSEAAPRVFLVVSGFSQEGKTTLSVNLALVLAELAPTCIVDADLRRPSVGPSFGLDAGAGVAEMLNGAPVETVLRSYPGVPNLRIALAGRPLANPGAALMSDAMGDLVAFLRERFTYVVIDSPPILGYADSRALVPLADGTIVVARYGRTTRDVINRTMDILRQLHASVLAFVLNEIDNQADYYKYKYSDVGREPDAEHAVR